MERENGEREWRERMERENGERENGEREWRERMERENGERESRRKIVI
jgi:hypothetical protein